MDRSHVTPSPAHLRGPVRIEALLGVVFSVYYLVFTFHLYKLLCEEMVCQVIFHIVVGTLSPCHLASRCSAHHRPKEVPRPHLSSRVCVQCNRIPCMPPGVVCRRNRKVSPALANETLDKTQCIVQYSVIIPIICFWAGPKSRCSVGGVNMHHGLELRGIL